MSGKLIVLCGMARAGKSTYCKQFDNKPKTVVVNSDQIRLALHGQRYNRLAEPTIHAITKVMVISLFNQGYICVIDETNTTISSIRQWLEIDSDAEFIYIDTSMEVCLQRAKDTGQEDLLKIIPKMYENLINLCNYTVDKRILTGKFDPSYRINNVNENDILMSIEDIRWEIKNASPISN